MSNGDLARTAGEHTMDREAREVLARILEYALGEAERAGASECACHVSQALDALVRTQKVSGLAWGDQFYGKPQLAS